MLFVILGVIAIIIFTCVMVGRLIHEQDCNIFMNNKKYRATLSNTIFVDENGEKVNKCEIFVVEGERLAYRGFHDGDYVRIIKNHPFKKRSIVLTNDFELFEVKTKHKDNTVSLCKNDKKKRVDINEIMGTVVGYYKTNKKYD